MNHIYVVRRAFKSKGNVYEVGTIVEDPTSITLLRSRIGSRDLLDLEVGDPKNATWLEYFSTRVSPKALADIKKHLTKAVQVDLGPIKTEFKFDPPVMEIKTPKQPTQVTKAATSDR